MSIQATYSNGEVSWRMVGYSQIFEETGELGVLEYGKELDFVVKRIFYLRGIKKNAMRGFHSHKDLKQLIVCLNGEFTIELDNGSEKISKRMKADNQCLYLDGKVWREMKDFTEDALIVVLCDKEYIYDEVVREYLLFSENIAKLNNDL